MPPPGSTRPRLSLAIQRACDPLTSTVLPSHTQLRRWVMAALQPNLQQACITLRFVDPEEGRELNRAYRGRGHPSKDYATNVLSFPYAEAPELEGDLVLCLPVITREAAEQGKPFRHHLAHLLIHGVLHLQGHDHEDPDSAERMEALERRLLARFRIPDPYQLPAERSYVEI